jgi:hypothetical protein
MKILTRHHFVKNISCSKHLEEEALCPDDEDLGIDDQCIVSEDH